MQNLLNSGIPVAVLIIMAVVYAISLDDVDEDIYS